MSDFLSSLAAQAMPTLASLLLTLLSALVVAGISYVLRVLQAQKENRGLALLLTALETGRQQVEAIVAQLQQTVVEQLKAKAQDGKLTADEIQEIRRMAWEKFQATMPKALAEVLRAAVGDLEAWVATEVERAVLKQKAQGMTVVPKSLGSGSVTLR
ncbi:MAG: hypothetical protein IMX00_04125 [Limnochordales bacterium]|nr:hypothetical protein [Limnochordales bacterium]